MIKTIKTQLFPRKKHIPILEEWIELCREIWNKGCEERLLLSAMREKQPSNYTQAKEMLTPLRHARPDHFALPCNVGQKVLADLHEKWRGFFTHMRNGNYNARPPGPKENGEFNRIPFGSKTRWKMHDKTIEIIGMGHIRFKPAPLFWRDINGTNYWIANKDVKTITILRKNNKWYIAFHIDMPAIPALDKTGVDAAIDMGVAAYITVADTAGNVYAIEKPKNKSGLWRRIGALRSRMTRYQKGSRQYRQLEGAVARLEQKNGLQNEHHRRDAVALLLKKYDRIACEDLGVANMLRKAGSRIGRRTRHAMSQLSFSATLNWLEYKSKELGKEVVFVNPAGTSQVCPACREKVWSNALNERERICPKCGWYGGRDEASCWEIGNRMYEMLGENHAFMPPEVAGRTAAVVKEEPARSGIHAA